MRFVWMFLLGLSWCGQAAAQPLVSLESGTEPSVRAEEPSSAPAAETAEGSEPFSCEVLAVETSAQVVRDGSRGPLAEGDLVRAGDSIEVPDGGSVDLAFDAEWKNVVRLEAGSQTTVRSVLPSRIQLRKAALYARLRQLPEGSSFEVETPTAIASVRGTEYRTSVAEDGSTDVSNFSDSPVYVTGPQGGEPRVLGARQITQVVRGVSGPARPRPMTDLEYGAGRGTGEKLGRKIEQVRQQGRVGRIQPVERMRQALRDGRAGPGVKPGRAPETRPAARQEAVRPGEPRSSQAAPRRVEPPAARRKDASKQPAKRGGGPGRAARQRSG